MGVPDVLLECEESTVATRLVRNTFLAMKPHRQPEVAYDFLLYRLRASVERGEWADVPELRQETAFAVAQRTARRLVWPESVSQPEPIP